MEVYKVNAFCNNIFSGNPSAICFMEDWREGGSLLQLRLISVAMLFTRINFSV